MLILLPVLFLFLAALILFILQALKVGYGTAWMVGAGFGLIVWALVAAEHWIAWKSNINIPWGAIPAQGNVITFQMDVSTWPYAFALASLVLAVLLTAPERLAQKANPWAWGGSLAITGAGLLAVMAGNVITLVLAWTILDVFELLIELSSVYQERITAQSVVAFGMRMVGSLLVLWSVLFGQSTGAELFPGPISPRVVIFLLLGIGLRLGVFPLHLPFTEEIPMRRGLGTSLRLVPVASSLLLLGRLQGLAIPAVWNGILIVFDALAILYCAAVWLASKDELNGRPYFLISMSGIVLASVLMGQPQATLAWGCSLILSGGLLFLLSSRQRSILFIPILGLLGLTGLPFTLAASGWEGLISAHQPVFLMIIIIAYSLLLSGYLRHSLRLASNLAEQERWIQVIYPTGLMVLVAAEILITIFGWPGSQSVSGWWASVMALVLAGGIYFVIWRWQTRTAFLEGRIGWLIVLGRRVGSGLGNILSLNWAYRLINFFYQVVQQIVIFLTVILEGDGGILWALLLLVLLISITQFQSRAIP